MKNINNVKNKYNWKYVFSYHNGNGNRCCLYNLNGVCNTTVLTYKTNKGINNATHYATNNMKWDAGSDLNLHGRKRIGKPLQKDIGKLNRFPFPPFVITRQVEKW